MTDAKKAEQLFSWSQCHCVFAWARKRQPLKQIRRWGGSGSNTSYPGHWDLTIKTPTQERASWIELSENKGRLEGLLIGLWGHATPTEIQIKTGKLSSLCPKAKASLRVRCSMESSQVVSS